MNTRCLPGDTAVVMLLNSVSLMFAVALGCCLSSQSASIVRTREGTMLLCTEGTGTSGGSVGFHVEWCKNETGRVQPFPAP